MQQESKILITAFGESNSSLEQNKQTLRLVEQLQKRGCELFLLSDNEFLLGEFEKHNWFGRGFWLGEGNQFVFAALYIFSLLSAIYALIYFKFKYKTDKLFCLTLPDKLIMTPIAKLLNYKIVWQEYELIQPVVSSSVYNFFYNWGAKYAKVVTAFSFIQDEIKKDNIKCDSCVINPGIDIELYKKQTDIFGAMAEKKFEFKERGRFTIGCIAELTSDCGMEYLIKALAIIRKENTDVELVIVGDGTQKENLQWLIGQLNLKDGVRIMGYNENFADCAQDFDVFVMPRASGSFDAGIIEAMACAKPMIAVGTGPTNEIIENEKSGLLVAACNPQILADAILRIKSDAALAEKIAVGGKKRVEEMFALNAMVAKYEEVFASSYSEKIEI